MNDINCEAYILTKIIKTINFRDFISKKLLKNDIFDSSQKYWPHKQKDKKHCRVKSLLKSAIPNAIEILLFILGYQIRV